MLSKSLIQFSVDGRGSVPSLLFDLKPNYGGGNENNSTSFRRSHACTAALSAPNPAAGHHDPRLCRDSWTLPGKSGSVSCKGPCSFLLGPGAHKVLFEPSEHLWRVWGLILNMISPLLPFCCGFCRGRGSGCRRPGCGISPLGGGCH